MGDQQHLGGFGQPLQPLAHRIGHRAADAAIHFVEHQRGGRRGLRQRHFQRQREARQLAARGDLGQRAEGGAFHGGDFEGDLLQAIGRAGLFGQRLQRDAEFGMAQFQRRQFGGDGGFQLPGGAGARLRQFAGGCEIGLARARRLAPRASFSDAPPPFKRLCLRPEIRQHRRQAVGRGAVFAGQRAQGEQPFFLAFQRPGVGVQAATTARPVRAAPLRSGRRPVPARFRLRQRACAPPRSVRDSFFSADASDASAPRSPDRASQAAAIPRRCAPHSSSARARRPGFPPRPAGDRSRTIP